MGTSSSNTKNIIEINGKSYDARNGSYLGNSLTSTPQPHPVHSVRGQSVDGFRRVSRGEAAAQPLKPTPTLKKLVALKHVARPSTSVHQPHPAAITLAPHQPQRATTLMRTAVSKPIIKSPGHIKAQTRTDILAKAPFHKVAPKISYNSINVARSQHAERMIKSPAVSRYHSGLQPLSTLPRTTDITPSLASVPVQSIRHQISELGRPINSRPDAVRQSASQHSMSASARSMNGFQPDLRAATAHRIAAVPTGHTRNVFEQALADVKNYDDSYVHQPSRSKRRGRSLRIVSISLLALFLIGFLTYQNTAGISLKVASYKAGVHASMPSQQPAGFSYGSLTYQPGDVTIGFNSPKDGRQYNITQKSSNWDSQALLNNFVASANTAYKTYQRAGRTVYLLSNDTATWVDSGIWYTVNGNASLSASQLLQVASHM